MNNQPILIDEVTLYKRLCQTSPTEKHQVFAFLLLELFHLFRDIAFDHARIRPLSLREGL